MTRWKWMCLRAAGAARKIVEKDQGYILGMFLFNGGSILWTLCRAEQYMVMLLDSVFLLAVLTMWTILVESIPLRWLRRIFFWGAFLLSALFWGMELFSIYHYQALVGAGIITAILETNSREAVEFLRMYVGWQVPAISFLGLLLGWSAWYWIFSKPLPLQRRWQRRLLFSGLLLGFAAGVELFFVYRPFILDNSLDIPALQVVTAGRMAAYDIGAYKDIDQKMPADVEILQDASDTPNIVFVLGEATNRGHMHLYGYALENTPNLDELQQKGEIVVFRDCISPYATTVGALRELFTFHDAESVQPWYSYHNLIDVMRAAGYKTYWLSNQESSGIWGNVAQLFARRSQVHEFTRMRESHEDFGALDEELFPMIDRARQQSGNKNFFVLHLMGGHSLYYMRFPYSFSRFTAADIARNLPEEKRTVLAQYANAIYYNDYIVSGIFDKFRDTEALVIYLPDHGETIYDDGSNFAGHVEENPNHYMLEVPMIIWASASYKERHPEKWAAIQAAADRPYMTDDMIHTILDLAGIQTAESDLTRSIVSGNFAAGRVRMVQGRDYDTDIRLQAAH